MDNNSTVIPADVWMRIVTNARIEPDGNIRILSEGLSEMCRTVDSFRGIPKESNESIRVTSTRKEYARLDNLEVFAFYVGRMRDMMPKLLVELDNINATRTSRKRKNISPEFVGPRIGLSKNTIRNNEALYNAYLQVVEENSIKR